MSPFSTAASATGLNNYHEPEPFRYALGAFVQATRNLTFMLQNEKTVFPDSTWYQEWAEQARKDPVLRWLHDARTDFVHRQSLEPHSWLGMRCVGNPRYPHGTDDDPFSFNVSPFECTHYYMSQGLSRDHAHEFTRYWGMEGLEGRELLEACADVTTGWTNLSVTPINAWVHKCTLTEAKARPRLSPAWRTRKS